MVQPGLSPKEQRLASFVGSGALGTVCIAGRPISVENQAKTLGFQWFGDAEGIRNQLLPHFWR